jgi:hypothetical protein
MSDSDMKQEYDFSNGVRGKFYKPGAALRYRYTWMKGCKRISRRLRNEKTLL